MGMEDAKDKPVDPTENPEVGNIEKAQETPISVEDLDRLKKELEQKVKDEQILREKDTDQKILDRQSLISKLKENDSLLEETRKLLEGYQQLNDPDSVSKVEELESLVDSLEKKAEEMNQQVESISDIPDDPYPEFRNTCTHCLI